MNKEQFIEKVKKQKEYITALDAYYLIHIYTDNFGVLERPFRNLGFELEYMWLKLKNDDDEKKICKGCKVNKPLSQFNKEPGNIKGKFRRAKCKQCISLYYKERYKNRKK